MYCPFPKKTITYFPSPNLFQGPFLLHWMPDVMKTDQLSSFLPIILNLVKYNAAYVDEDVMAGLVQSVPSPDSFLSFWSRYCQLQE